MASDRVSGVSGLSGREEAGAVEAKLLRAIGAADRASTSMTPYGPMNDKWMRGFLDALAAEGLGIVEVSTAKCGWATGRMECDAPGCPFPDARCLVVTREAESRV